MPVDQLKAGAALSYVVLGLNSAIGLLFTPYILRSLGQSEFGLYSLIASVISYLTILDFGLGNAIIRYTAKFRVEKKTEQQYETFGLFLLIYCIISVIAVIGGFLLYSNMEVIFGETMGTGEIAKARIMVLVLTFNLAITFPLSVFSSAVIAYENFVFQKLAQVIRITLSTAMMLVMLKLGYKAIALVIITTVFNVIYLLSNFIYVRYRLKIKVRLGKFRFGFLREVLVYSFYIFLAAVMDKIYFNTGQFILGAVSGTLAVSLYAVAMTLQQMYMGMSTAISGVFLPRVTAMVTRGCTDGEISDMFVKTGRIQYILLAFILTGYYLFGRPFIILWAGSEYELSYIIGLIFMVPLTVPFIQSLGVVILQARNKMKFRSVLYVMIASASIAVSIPLAKKYGAVGCAAGTSGAIVLGQVITMNIYYYRSQKIDIPLFWKNIARMSLVPILFSVSGYFILRNIKLTDWASLTGAVMIFIFIYVPFFWRFSMNKYEKDLAMTSGRSVWVKIAKRNVVTPSG